MDAGCPAKMLGKFTQFSPGLSTSALPTCFNFLECCLTLLQRRDPRLQP
jgi:hypothetical protein